MISASYCKHHNHPEALQSVNFHESLEEVMYALLYGFWSAVSVKGQPESEKVSAYETLPIHSRESGEVL